MTNSLGVGSWESISARGVKSEIFAGCAQIILKHGNNKGVILALWQTRNCNGADATGSHKENRKTAAVRRIVFCIKFRFLLQSDSVALLPQTDGIGTTVIAQDNVAFPANPIPIVRCSPCHGVRKESVPIELNVNGHGDSLLFGGRFEGGPKSPRHFGVKMLEPQPFFLQSNFLKLLINIHMQIPNFRFSPRAKYTFSSLPLKGAAASIVTLEEGPSAIL